MKEVLLKFKAETKDAEKNVENLNQDVQQTKKSAEDTNKAIDSGMEALDKRTNGAISGLKSLRSGLGSVISGMKTLRFAIAATGIGALLLAITSLTAYFTKTERGAQKLRVIMAALGSIVDNLVDVVIGLGESLVDAFENPKKTVQELGDSIKTYVIDAVQNIMEGLGLLGDAFSKLLEGDFAGALDTAKEGAKQLGSGLWDLSPVGAVFNTLSEGAQEFAKDVMNDVRAAASLADRLNKVKVAERELRVERAEANAVIERQKFISDDITRSYEERLQAARNAFTLEQDLLDRQLANERERLAIMEQQASLAESDEETLEAIADQRIKLAELEQASATKQIELNNKINALENERKMKAEEATAKAEEARLKEEEARNEELKAREEAIQKITEATLSQTEAEILAVQQKYDELIRLADKYGQDTVELREKASKEIQAIEDKAAKEEKERQKAVAKQKEDVTATAVNTALSLAEEGSTVQKSLAVAQSLWNTYQGITTALGSAPPPFNFISAALTGAAGFAAVRNILSTSPENAGSSGGGVGSVPSTASSGASGAPNVSLLGGNNPLSQISDALRQNAERPPKAIVVGQEVTSQQAADRRIFKKAQLAK